MNNIIAKYFITTLNIVLGLFIICYTIYIRLIVTRLPKSLYCFDDEQLKYSLFIFIIGSFFLCGFFLIKTILLLNKRNTSENYFTRYIKKITAFIEQSLFEVYILILNLIPESYDKVSKLATHFYDKMKDKSEILFPIILLAIRIIILFAFLIDVFFFFKLIYMYKVLYLLCISLIIRILFFVLKDFSHNLDEISSYLIITDMGIDKITGLPITDYKLHPAHSDLSLSYYIEQYLLCSKLTGYLINYEKYKQFLEPFFHLFIYSLYFIAWFYIIYQNYLTYING